MVEEGLTRREIVMGALLWGASVMLPGCATKPVPEKELVTLLPGKRVKFEDLDFKSLPNEIPFPGRVVLVIREKQVLGYYEEGKMVMSTGTSTGMQNHETTPGVHRIFKRAEHYHSKKYNAPMPMTQMFTEDGQSIHESPNVGVRVYRDEDGNRKEAPVIQRAFNSHGCLGLSNESARFLWDRMQIGDLVIVR